MAAVPKRATAAEAALQSKAWTPGAIRDAIAALAADFQPIDDMRASADYRMRTAGALLERFFAEHSGRGQERVEAVEAIAP